MNAIFLVLITILSIVTAIPRLVIDQDFPDPSIIEVNNTWYAFATQHGSTLVQIARSEDWDNWSVLPDDAFGCLPSWMDRTNPHMWAPDVFQRADGVFALYFSGLAANLGHHCLGVALAEQVRGPYIPIHRPLACPDPLGTGANTNPTPYMTAGGRGGAIDGSAFRDDDGSLYIVFKVDGNSLGPKGDACNNGGPESEKIPTPIILMPVEQDGFTPKGDAYEILDRLPEDGPLVEAPSLFRNRDGVYNLVYSSGCFLTSDYNIKLAKSNSIRGPYERLGTLAVSGDAIGSIAPGGADIASDGVHIAFHADLPGDQRHRGMFVGSVSSQGNTLVLS